MILLGIFNFQTCDQIIGDREVLVVASRGVSPLNLCDHSAWYRSFLPRIWHSSLYDMQQNRQTLHTLTKFIKLCRHQPDWLDQPDRSYKSFIPTTHIGINYINHCINQCMSPFVIISRVRLDGIQWSFHVLTCSLVPILQIYFPLENIDSARRVSSSSYNHHHHLAKIEQ